MLTQPELLLLLKVVEWHNPEFSNDFNILEYTRAHQLIEREIENAYSADVDSFANSPISNWSVA